LVRIEIIKGKSAEYKKTLIESITAKLGARLGLAPTDVFIVMHEPPDANWGIGGKQKE